MTRPFDLSLYLVVGRPACGGRSLQDVVQRAVTGGVTLVQLRDPDAATRDLVKDARALLGLLRPRGIPLIINDRVDVTLASDADGVHLGQDDMAATEARAILGPQRLIGLSVGSRAEAEGSRLDLACVDYVGVGPIRATSTKGNAGGAIGVAGFSTVLALLDRPAVAIGGLVPGSVGEVIRAGAAGAAVVSAICGAADPEQAARELWSEIAAARR